MIRELHLKRVGPAAAFNVTFAERLNLFTGDNDLGKTFLLDIAWWALTGTWAGNPAWPQRIKGESAEISYHLIGKTGPTKESTTSRYDFSHADMATPEGAPSHAWLGHLCPGGWKLFRMGPGPQLLEGITGQRR